MLQLKGCSRASFLALMFADEETGTGKQTQTVQGHWLLAVTELCILPPKSFPSCTKEPTAFSVPEEMVQRLVSISGDPSTPFIFSSDVLAAIPLERCPESNQIPVSDCAPHFGSGSLLRAGPRPSPGKQGCRLSPQRGKTCLGSQASGLWGRVN